MSHPNMIYRSLGKCGTKVSLFSLGGWTTFGGSVKEKEVTKAILKRAYEAGVNFFDIADVYSHGNSEIAMGEVLREFPRHELVISSKLFWAMSEDINDRGLSRKHIMESIDKSLKRIGTDYLDIYFCHRYDEETPLEETIRAMDDLVHRGKILYWGTSEWTLEQIDKTFDICMRGGYYPPQVEQPQYSLLAREKYESNAQKMAEKWGLGLVTWSPLASGMLTGKYDEGMEQGRLSQMEWLKKSLYTSANIEKVKEFKKLADGLGCTRSQLAVAWVAAQKSVSSVILGATRLEQLEENLQALKVEISAEVDNSLRDIFV